MKRIILIFVTFLLISFSLKAGDGDTYFSFAGGLLFKNAFSGELTFEKEISSHGGWEVGIDFYNRSFGDIGIDSIGNKVNHYAILAQGAYKAILLRNKNSNIRWRFAAGIGANEKGFTCSVTPGIEYNYTFSNNVQFFILEKNQFSFWTSDKSWIRCGIILGIKIPF